MADNPSAYQDLHILLEVAPGDHRVVREALFKFMFPEGLGTRSITRFRHLVVPLILDLLDEFIPSTSLIESNVFFFQLLDRSIGEAALPANVATSFLRLLYGLVLLGTEEVSSETLSSLLEQHFPALVELLASGDDGPRPPRPGYVPYARFLFNLKSLVVSRVENNH